MKVSFQINSRMMSVPDFTLLFSTLRDGCNYEFRNLKTGQFQRDVQILPFVFVRS